MIIKRKMHGGNGPSLSAHVKKQYAVDIGVRHASGYSGTWAILISVLNFIPAEYKEKAGMYGG